jgi:hypothetical protein
MPKKIAINIFPEMEHESQFGIELHQFEDCGSWVNIYVQTGFTVRLEPRQSDVETFDVRTYFNEVRVSYNPKRVIVRNNPKIS